MENMEDLFKRMKKWQWLSRFCVLLCFVGVITPGFPATLLSLVINYACMFTIGLWFGFELLIIAQRRTMRMINTLIK